MVPRPAPRIRFAPLATVLVVAALAVLGSWAAGLGPDRAPAGETSAREEFEAIAARLRGGPDPVVGHGRIPTLRAWLRRPGLHPDQRRAVSIDLSRELLRLGEVDEAIALLDEEVAAARQGGRRPSVVEPELFRARAMAHLRRAEVENCVRRHEADCCIFPLAGGGLHDVAEPARLARRDLLRYLDAIASEPGRQRDRATARWLLNVACMALDEYPEGVPAAHRVPLSALGAEEGIGRFSDAAPRLGVGAFDLAGGAIVDDLDGDGRLDLVSSTCDPGGPLKAFRNAGDGTFEDVSSAWGLDGQLGGLHLVGADYDNDGGLDLLVLRGAWMFEAGRIRNSLLRNDGGHFEDVTHEAGLAEPPAPTQAAAWGDFDGDGWLDLYVGNESSGRPDAPDHPSQLFHADGDGGFTDVAPGAGVTNDRYAKGVAVGDHDRDGDLDLYVSNNGPNRLYRNDGGLRFTDVAPQLGLTEPVGRSFACWFFDQDEDGDLDLWVNAYSGATADVLLDILGEPNRGDRPRLYRNAGDGTFRDVAAEVGIERSWLPMGAGFGDLDNDGWLDVYLGTGDPSYETIVPNVALRNDGGRRFVDVTRSAGLGHLQKGHGVVFADVDDDGDQDLFHQLGGFFPGDAFQNALFLNPGHGNRHLVLELVGVRTNRMAVGAHIEVRVETPEGPRAIHRDVGSISSFGSAPRRQEIGLGRATAVASIEVRWPTSGMRQTFRGAELDRAYRITEGEPDLEPLRREPLALDADPAGSPSGQPPSSNGRTGRGE